MRHSAMHWSVALTLYALAVLVTMVPPVLRAARQTNSQGDMPGSRAAFQKTMQRILALDMLYLAALLGYRFLFF